LYGIKFIHSNPVGQGGYGELDFSEEVVFGPTILVPKFDVDFTSGLRDVAEEKS
jgi:hypothetical protein